MVEDKKTKSEMNKKCGSGGDAFYGLGLFGALFYYIQNASNFSEGLIGVFKAIFWPAFMVYEILTRLQL